MKKIAIIAGLLALTGCVQVDRYQDVIKHPVPAELAGYWQSKGPQSSMVSPEAIATLVVTQEGDTLDCRQWQRVVAVPGKIMLRSDDYYNVTRKLDIYPLEREGSAIEYDGMSLQRVDKPTVECANYLSKNPLESKLPYGICRPGRGNAARLSTPYYSASITHTLTLPPLQVKTPVPVSSVITTSSRLPRKSFQVLWP